MRELSLAIINTSLDSLDSAPFRSVMRPLDFAKKAPFALLPTLSPPYRDRVDLTVSAHITVLGTFCSLVPPLNAGLLLTTQIGWLAC